MAYIGDCTPEKERGGGMGMLGAASGIGYSPGYRDAGPPGTDDQRDKNGGAA